MRSRQILTLTLASLSPNHLNSSQPPFHSFISVGLRSGSQPSCPSANKGSLPSPRVAGPRRPHVTPFPCERPPKTASPKKSCRPCPTIHTHRQRQQQQPQQRLPTLARLIRLASPMTNPPLATPSCGPTGLTHPPATRTTIPTRMIGNCSQT